MWPTFLASSLYSCTTSLHAESPPPKTLISHGARDWVQTSTSPDEISFWVQEMTGKQFCVKRNPWVCIWTRLRLRGSQLFSVCACCHWPFFQWTAEGAVPSQTTVTECLWLHLQETVVCGICREQHNYKHRFNLKCHVRNEIFQRQNSLSWLKPGCLAGKGKTE